jgi:thiamine biosynthesis protein ThiI
MRSSPQIINVHYGEIALKGKNRGQFERTLINNIKKTLENEHYESLEKKATRIIIKLSNKSDLDSIIAKLKKVFGIKWFSVAFTVERDIELLKKSVLNIAEAYRGKSIQIETKRADKSFPLTSIEVSKIVGAELKNAGFQITFDKPDATILIEILDDEILVSSEKLRGLGGLPVGTSGKVLSLLSGGIDSPVAAWLMMKRGCCVDFLHVHPYQYNEIVKKSKIVKLIEKLKEYAPIKMRLYIAPYAELYKKTFYIPSRNELVVFRRFLKMLAERIATEHGYLGIVTGDSLAQVASQTLDNLYVTSSMSTIPFYRPLIGYDKDEIIELAKKIGTYEISIEEYKDCCSLVATRHPATKTKLDEIKKIEEEIDIENIVENTMLTVEIIEF